MREVIDSLDEVADLLELAAADPSAAADRLEAWGYRLLVAARGLREAAAQEGGGLPTSTGGAGDRVKVRAVRPDGSTETGASGR
jgi:hypothetical protein